MSLEQSLCERFGIKLWVKGTDFAIYRITSINPNAKEFLDNLEGNINRKALALIDTVKDNRDVLKNPEKSETLGDGLFELKPTNQVRLPYFYDKDSILIITHGFLKKRRKTPTKQIERAKRLREEYLTRKGR